MAGLLTTASTLMCPHGGTVTAVPSSGRVSVQGSPVVVSTDTFTIAGCPFMLGTSPHPCMLVDWQHPTQKTKAGSVATLTEASVGFCKAADGAVQGPVQVVSTQQKATSL
jgi:hypothetical protein